MTTDLKIFKTLSVLPLELEADSIYFVRIDQGFDIYVTTKVGGLIVPIQINQVQADWLITNNQSKAFIKNKPDNYFKTLGPLTLNTTSTTFIPVTNLLINEIKNGKYLLNFGCSLSHGTTNASIFTRISMNGVNLPESELQWQRGGSQGNIIGVHNYSGFPIDLGEYIPENPEFATFGTGIQVNGLQQCSPVNNYYRRAIMQMVYTAAELQAIGFQAGSTISEIGWYITNSFDQTKPGYIIKMKHTTQNDVSTALGITDWSVVKTAFDYTTPRPINGWDMIPLDTNFAWNGVDNIGIEVCWSQTAAWSETGQQYIIPSTNGFRYSWDDDAGTLDGTSPATLDNIKPQIRFKASNLAAIETVNGVTIDWRVSAGTGTMINPYLSLIGL